MNRPITALFVLFIFAATSCKKETNNSPVITTTAGLQGNWDLVLIKGTIAGGSHIPSRSTTLKIKPGISLTKMESGVGTFFTFSTTRDSSVTYGRMMDFFVLNGQKSNMFYFVGDTMVLEADGISDAAYEYYVKE
jgi:hypothetical protein